MKITVSTENSTMKKTKIGEFDNPRFASMFVDSILQTSQTSKEYIKLIVESAEEDNER